MRKFIIAACFAATSASASAAGGTWDGIYSCGYNVLGFVYNIYVTINGQPDGRAIFAVAAVTDNTPFYGYGIGAISGNTFSGNTMLGLPFSATATTFGFTGRIRTVVGSLVVDANGICTKIW